MNKDDKIIELENKLAEMEEKAGVLLGKIESLESSSSISRDVETALRERLGVVTGNGTTGGASTQSVSVPSTPTNITVPAQPSGTVSVTIGGVTYNLLYA